jgi:hypothetical protein
MSFMLLSLYERFTYLCLGVWPAAFAPRPDPASRRALKASRRCAMTDVNPKCEKAPPTSLRAALEVEPDPLEESVFDYPRINWVSSPSRKNF